MVNTFLQDALPLEEMNSAKEHCRSADLVLCLGTRYIDRLPYYHVIDGIIFAGSFNEISIITNFLTWQLMLIFWR